MTKKEKDAIIAQGKADAEAKAKAEEAEKDEANLEEEEDSEIIDDESDEEDEPDEDSKKNEDIDIDYEEIAKKETERANAAEEARKKAEDALAEKNFKKRKDKREGKEEEDVDEDDEDKPLTRRELRSVLSEANQQNVQQAQSTEALRIARENTSSENEAQAAILFWKNRVKPTGNLEEDVLFAIGGLNRKKVVAEKSEVIRALKSKENSSKSFASTQRTGSPAEKGKITSRDAEALKGAGMVWDGTKRVYKKPIGDGKTFFFYDPKSKKRWKGK